MSHICQVHSSLFSIAVDWNSPFFLYGAISGLLLKRSQIYTAPSQARTCYSTFNRSQKPRWLSRFILRTEV